MELHIVSPLKQWSVSIAWAELNSVVGNFVIEPEHAPMIVTLTPNSPVHFGLISGKQDSLIVQRGIAHITRESVTLLLSDV